MSFIYIFVSERRGRVTCLIFTNFYSFEGSVTRLLLFSLIVHTKVQKPLHSQHSESAVLM